MQTIKALNLYPVTTRLLTMKLAQPTNYRFKSKSGKSSEQVDDTRAQHYPNTSAGIKERSIRPEAGTTNESLQTPYPPFPDGKNPKTGEQGGPTGPEPTRFGDWERKGRVTDF